MKKLLKDYAFLFSIAGTIVLLDQWTKILIRQNLGMGEVLPIADWLTPYARIVHWYNTGVSFGMLQGSNDIFKIFILAVVIAIIAIFPRISNEHWTLRLAMAMQLGGAYGNMLDRFIVGHVTDFISVGNFPVFNVADSSITIGVVVLLLGFWLQDRKEKQAKKALTEGDCDELTSQGDCF